MICSYQRSIAVLGGAHFAFFLFPITPATADNLTTCIRGVGPPAIVACTRVISAGQLTNSDLVLVYSTRGLRLHQAGKSDDALADFGKAIQINPRSAFPYGGRGAVFLAKGDYNRAIESLTTGLRLSPSDSLYSLRGDAYSKKEQHDLAIADYNSALNINPKFELAFAGRGQSYFALGDYDRAIADLSLAIQIDRSDPNPYVIRGRTYAKKGDYTRAIADLTTAITIRHPRTDIVYLARADAYENHDDLREALTDYRKAATSDDVRLAKEANAGIQRVQSKIANAGTSTSVSPQSTGSGFVINSRGHFLTNYHVIKGCSKLRLGSAGSMNEAVIFATDKNNDLAILRSTNKQQPALLLRGGQAVRPADQVVIVGFPLTGTGLLSSSANVSTGSVSALAGPGDDSRLLQISAPIQPGNSGGPVLDLSGNVVGVVVATLNAAAMLKSEGILPQNINFAIKSSIAANFLDAKGVPYETASSETKFESGDVATKGTRSTVLIECYK